MSSLKYVLSQRGSRMLQYEGFLYYKEKVVRDSTVWKCVNYKLTSGLCPARAVTIDDEVDVRKDHNHSGEAVDAEVREIKANIRKRSRATRDAPKYLLAETLSSCSQAAQPNLRIRNLKRVVRGVRRKVQPKLKNPERGEEFVIPEYLTLTRNGTQFVLYDSGQVRDRVLIFGTAANLQVLRRRPHWFVDGTFKHCPRAFTQIFTIHALQNHRCLPLVYALLPDKKESTYDEMLNALVELEPALYPKSILSDFERTILNSFSKKFPNAEQRGCFFHFNQCIYREIQGAGLKRRYDEDPDFALKMRFLSALAFVPTPDVVTAFEYLVTSQHFPDEVEPVIEYFEDVWIGRPRSRTTRKPPLYQHALWNCYDVTLEGLPRTNNAVEGWHRGFDSLTTRYHESLWETIDNFRREQTLCEATIEEDVAGGPPPPKKRKYVRAEDRLQAIVLTYEENEDLQDYLRGIAHNIKY